MSLKYPSTSLPLPDARAVATALIDAGCVSARTDEPFRLPSGWASPVYMDCRRLISFPPLRRGLIEAGLAMLRNDGALDGIDAVVGGESSGIALAAWMAEELDLPLHYVRKKAAGQSQIEGAFRRGDRVLLVDDMIAAGHSKVRFVRALQAAGLSVSNVFVVFDYGTFNSRALLAPLGVKLHALADWRDVMAEADERTKVAGPALDELRDFLANPGAWSQAHGGIAGGA